MSGFKGIQEIRDIHNPFIQWLRERKLPYVHSNPTTHSTIAKGHPDFLISSNGRCLFIECKRPDKGRLSDDQIMYIEFLRRAGNTVIVARSYEECVSATEDWLAGKTVTEKPVPEAPDDSPLRLMKWRNVTYVVKVDGKGGHTIVKEASVHDLRELRMIG